MVILARETVLIALVCFFDLVLTVALLSTGLFIEANPLLAHYLQYGVGAMCVVKLCSFTFPLALAEYYRHQQPIFVQFMLRATLCLYIVGYFAGVTAVNLPVLFCKFP